MKLFRLHIQAEPGQPSRDVRSRTRCLDDISRFDVLLETLRIAKAEATAVLSTREHLLTNGVIALLGHVIRDKRHWTECQVLNQAAAALQRQRKRGP